MLPRVRAGEHAAKLGWLVCGMLALGCGSPEQAPVVNELPASEPQQVEGLVDGLIAEPSPTSLMAVLAQPHEVAQATGPHRIAWEAHFETEPTEIPRLVPVDEPAPEAYKVDDKLVLEWAPGNPERLYLRQGPEDPPACHEYMVVDKNVYTRLPHRGWLTHPLEAGAHRLWLDEAQRGPHDVIAFAAPALAVATAVGESSVEVTLSLAESVDANQVAQGTNRAWRQSVSFTRIDGSVEIDRTTGLWRAATIDVGYAFEDVRGHRVTGVINFRGQLTTGLAADNAVRAPPDEVESTPNRVRYEVEKRELLKGLIHL